MADHPSWQIPRSFRLSSFEEQVHPRRFPLAIHQTFQSLAQRCRFGIKFQRSIESRFKGVPRNHLNANVIAQSPTYQSLQ